VKATVEGDSNTCSMVGFVTAVYWGEHSRGDDASAREVTNLRERRRSPRRGAGMNRFVPGAKS